MNVDNCSLSLPICHCQSVTANLSLPICHCQSVTATMSLPICPCQSVTANLSLPICHCQSVTANLSLPICHCQSVPANLFLPICHSQYVTANVSVVPAATSDIDAFLTVERMFKLYWHCCFVLKLYTSIVLGWNKIIEYVYHMKASNNKAHALYTCSTGRWSKTATKRVETYSSDTFLCLHNETMSSHKVLRNQLQ